MTTWRFVESDEDGRMWMQNPTELHALIDIRSGMGARNEMWRRITVVTKGWVTRQLAGSQRAVFSAMLVVPDAEPAALRASIDAAVSAGGLEHFAAALE